MPELWYAVVACKFDPKKDTQIHTPMDDVMFASECSFPVTRMVTFSTPILFEISRQVLQFYPKRQRFVAHRLCQRPPLRCIPQGCACKTAEEREEQENQLRDAIRSLHTYVAHSCWAAGNCNLLSRQTRASWQILPGPRFLLFDFGSCATP